MAITLGLRTDAPHQVRIANYGYGYVVHAHLGKFPQASASVLVCTQLFNASVVQEETQPIPADLGDYGIPPGFVQSWESSMGLPPLAGYQPQVYSCLPVSFPLLPPGGGTNTVRLKLLDGATVVFDEPFSF